MLLASIYCDDQLFPRLTDVTIIGPCDRNFAPHIELIRHAPNLQKFTAENAEIKAIYASPSTVLKEMTLL